MIIDGGNSFYKDDIRRAAELYKRGVPLCGCGHKRRRGGTERGYCLMIGAHEDAFKTLEPIFKTLAPGLGDIPRTPGREKLGGTAEYGYYLTPGHLDRVTS